MGRLNWEAGNEGTGVFLLVRPSVHVGSGRQQRVEGEGERSRDVDICTEAKVQN